MVHDVLMVALSWVLAYWLRLNLDALSPEVIQDITKSLLVVVPVQLMAFVYIGLYKGVWRFASIPDIVRILKAVVMGVVIGMVILFLWKRGVGMPRSVPVIHAALLVLMLSGPRLLYRWLKDRHLYLSTGQRVLIVGAGQAGEMLARDLLRDSNKYQLIAFVDDKDRRLGREIHGIPVTGKTRDICQIVEKHQIDIIMLAIPSASAKQMQRIIDYCEESGVPFRSVPLLQDLVSGKVAINDIREVSIEDLLGRDLISLDWKDINSQLSRKRILITGGGGSIGSELCRQIALMQPENLILVESSEFNLYAIEMELRKTFPELDLQCKLGDVIDSSYVEYIFQAYRPNVVFHAAAYKHVPMLEAQIRQALRNNVLGTRCVAEAADRYAVDEFVLVSTDKAVNPANIMGASKRAAEIFCQNLNARSATKYITVRFGNVLGSAGSVIPLFRKQIASGGPVTVTDSRMERYFMTIPEACQLIMQTTVLGDGGEIFVLDMGEPVKIKYLAEQMIRLSGKLPGEDIEITYTGLRPGEKLYEELFHEKEHLEGTSHEKVFLARHRKVDWNWLVGKLEGVSEACEEMDDDALSEYLNALVPEYHEKSSMDAGLGKADVVYISQ